MRMIELIEKKKYGKSLSEEEIRWMIEGYVKEEIPDYQMSAMLMAVYFRGMTDEELTCLTMEMAHSGEMVDLSAIDGVKVDKHSTGGVGDKTTLVLAPLVAVHGVKVAKMSGRGLGHTGGTVDKMESIPGFKTAMSKDEFFSIVNNTGVSVIGQSADLAPADKKLYALRDVTGTVDSIPLIAASVMSKKLAAGSDCILLDVTCGSGAFMQNKEDAVKLAEKMVAIGNGAGKKTVALITNMNTPLGSAIGNSLEIMEVVEALKGEGPEDLKEVCLHLAANMLYLADEYGNSREKNAGTQIADKDSEAGTLEAGNSNSGTDCAYHREIEPYIKKAEKAIADGSAFKKLLELVRAQGGDASVLENTDGFKKAEYFYDVVIGNSGYITGMDAKQCGIASMLLGAGRETKESGLDETAGIRLYKKTGDRVQAGDTIATLYSSSCSRFREAEEALVGAYHIGKEAPAPEKNIIARVTKNGVEWL